MVDNSKHERLAQKLLQARQEAKLTQVQASKLLKQPQSYFSKIERGERKVDAIELAEFAKIYKKPVSYFI